jgi:protein-S-isoprenylcysteine O-methyltransferase Ste14
MNGIRYWLAVILMVTGPPAILWWFVVHPFIGFWRRLGKLLSTLVVLALMLAAGYFLYQGRDTLLVRDLGTNRLLWAPALLLFLLSVYFDTRAKKHLKVHIMTGMPELDPEGSGTPMLKQGIYASVRHPRYVAVIVGITAFALFVNYLGTYVLTVLAVPALWLVVILEERELAERYGREYEQYQREVPMFFPRVGSRTER